MRSCFSGDFGGLKGFLVVHFVLCLVVCLLYLTKSSKL